MYSLPYFKEKDSSKVLAFMQQHPFAMLIGADHDLPVATQVPLLIEERENKIFLLGHLMRQTDHHKAFEKNCHALCVFTGAQAYVSASWYTQPQVASTWNYMSVQAKGILKFTDETQLLHILERTTRQFEQNDQSPASYHHLPQDYVQKLAKAIVGFEIEVTALEHTFKLSQNRDAGSYRNIIHQLQQQDAGDAHTIAAEMSQRSSQLFNAAGKEG